jgi:hypothetical protein
MNDNGDRDYSQPNRWNYEPWRFKSLVAQLHREAQQRRRRAYDQTPHEAPLVRVTKWLVVATIALAVAAFLGFGVAILQWRAMSSTDEKTGQNVATLQEQASTMKGQLDVMRDEFTATNRPWISLNSKPEITAPLIFGDNGNINTSVHFSLINSGRTPGIFVYPNVTFILMTTGNQLSQIIRNTREYCERNRFVQFSPMEGGILSPPGKTVNYPAHFGLAITPTDINANKEVVRSREAMALAR